MVLLIIMPSNNFRNNCVWGLALRSCFLSCAFQILEYSGGLPLAEADITAAAVAGAIDVPVLFFGDFAKYSSAPLTEWNVVWDW
jgi:hypothetical protein